VGISAVGQSGLSTRSIRSMLVVIFVLLAAAIYFYGPMVTPGMERAAAEQCNEHAGGNFRSYRLDWVTWPDADPHWSCWDAREPEVKAVDLGWWTNPFS
jgi:hypothetical protein